LIIVSKFHEWYDGCMSLGYGGVQYIRETSIIEFDWPGPQVPQCDVIGFAGKVYLLDSSMSGTFRYDHEMNRDCKKYHGKEEIVNYRESLINLGKLWYNNKRLLQFIGDIERNNTKWFNVIYDKYKVPVFYYSRERKELILNPVLNHLQFYRVLDAYQAYQELSVFLSNVSLPEKIIPTISNNDMIEAKGFDLKSSFRKSKNESGKKRS
jgi:hypothetical protein